jgi:hypothetical protein
MKITVHIERLILDGLPVERRDGSTVQAAVEAELTRLLVAEGLAPGLMSGGATPTAPGGTIHLTGETNPTHMGTQIAQAVHGGLINE